MINVLQNLRPRPSGTLNLVRGKKAAQAVLTAAGQWSATVKSPNAGCSILIADQTGTPFVMASEYNFTTKRATVLTVTGALSARNQATRSNVVLAGSTIFLHHHDATYSAIVPYTLSGTTLTRGTIVDISAQVPVADNDKWVMSTDGTYLYFTRVDTGVMKRYTIAGGAWTTMTAPTAISGATRQNTRAFKSGNYIYILNGQATSTIKMYRYLISGDSWSTVTTAPPLLWNKNILVLDASGNCCVAADPSSDAYFYVGIMNSANKNIVFRVVPSTNTWTDMMQNDPEGNENLWTSSGNHHQVNYMDFSQNLLMVSGGNSSDFYDYTEVVMVGVINVSGAGTFAGMYDGAGANGSYTLYTLWYEVDGGTPKPLYLGKYLDQMGNGVLDSDVRIPFATSFKLYAITGKEGYQEAAYAYYLN